MALPAPGDDIQGGEGQVEADMHAAIASVELANYAKVGDASCCPLQVFTGVLLFFGTVTACTFIISRGACRVTECCCCEIYIVTYSSRRQS